MIKATNIETPNQFNWMVREMRGLNTMDKPQFIDLKFKGKEEFEAWLKETASYKIHFADYGQDFLVWYLHESGEVLHSDLQARIWNGKFVDIKNMKENMPLPLSNGDCIKYEITKIEKLK